MWGITNKSFPSKERNVLNNNSRYKIKKKWSPNSFLVTFKVVT